MECGKCKAVKYCSAECQRQDWPDHRPLCKRKDFQGAPCDVCKDPEMVIDNLCYFCGYLFCIACDNAQRQGDAVGSSGSYSPCPGCHHQRPRPVRGDFKKLEMLIQDKKNDPRLPRWLNALGQWYKDLNTFKTDKKAKASFLRAGELGLGEGYTRLAEVYFEKRNWDETRRYYQKGADLMNVRAINALAIEAQLGYFNPHGVGVIQEDQRRPPDLNEAFRLTELGARLGDSISCTNLAMFYSDGIGTQINHSKSFKWARRAAEKGDYAMGMRLCGNYYRLGHGVEQSDEQARYWYEKSLELED
jgi:TPR repeat protein